MKWQKWWQKEIYQSRNEPIMWSDIVREAKMAKQPKQMWCLDCQTVRTYGEDRETCAYCGGDDINMLDAINQL